MYGFIGVLKTILKFIVFCRHPEPIDYYSTVSDITAGNFVDYGASKPQNYVRLKVCLQHVFIKHKNAFVNSQNIQKIFFICTSSNMSLYVIYKNVDIELNRETLTNSL